ncbi:MAG: hypothetical protein ACXAC8_05130 [Candidatus Hodarchaeales archaeon]
MVGRNVHLSILIVGFIFALLTLITDQPIEIVLTILYLTLVVLLLVKLTEEWRYYQNYNAPLASAIFLLIPSIIMLGGTFIAPIASLGESGSLQLSFIDIDLDANFFGLGDYSLFLNIFSSLFVLIPGILPLYLLRKYYSGRYPAVFIFRKKYTHEFVLLYNVGMILMFSMIWFQTRTIELSGLGFILISTALFIQHYVLKVALVPIRRIPSSRSSNQRTSAINSTSANRASQTTLTRPRRINNQHPRRNTSSTTSQFRNNQQVSRGRTRSIGVVPGIETSNKLIEKLSPGIISNLIPAGHHLTEDDFRCIFCYEFPTDKDIRIVICPHCRHPSHEYEMQKWKTMANICSRCNKPISDRKLVRVSGKNYTKLIDMFRNKRLKHLRT